MALSSLHVCVVGAGLSGSIMALLLAKLGFTVSIYEKRPDFQIEEDDEQSKTEFGTSTSATKRSINLALSYRGQIALQEVGILDKVMENAIPMPKRVIHSKDSDSNMLQPYGKDGEAINSVGRETINNYLLDLIKANKTQINLHFDHKLVSISKDGECTFQHKKNTFTKKFDLVVGADGAYSGVRENLLKQGRINFSRHYISHGYKELCIPPMEKLIDGKIITDFALNDHEGLHIWPRGEFMLIALPNPDKSFTATLFAPYQGEDGFDSVDPNSPKDIMAYFEKHFPDVIPLMPDLINDYKNNPVGSLVTIRTDPWHFGKIILLGDAAHAVVPFYGQGMNAAFEDGLIFYNILKKKFYPDNPAGMIATAPNLEECAKEFAIYRQPAADALADLCLEHYHDMAANTASTFYLLTKRIETTLNSLFPKTFLPLYTMVAFTNIPYHEAVERSNKQQRFFYQLAGINVAIGGIATAFAIYNLFGKK